MSELEPSDKRSAFTGMIVTAVLLFVLAFAIVQMTNAQYAGEQEHAGAAK